MGNLGLRKLEATQEISTMADTTKVYWLHVLTPLHVGSGRGVGFVDLPIMREKVTNWPLVPGSAVKGVLADHFGATDEARRRDDGEGRLLRATFGRVDEEGESANSGSLVFTDARLVCLPVRSLSGTFAWVTSRLALQRLARDLQLSGLGNNLAIPPPLNPEEIYCCNLQESVLRDPTSGKIYFEDLDFSAQDCSEVTTSAAKIAEWIFRGDTTWQEEFKKRFAVVNDDTFDFLSETTTEINARVRIEPEKKVVAKGALWYEESLSAESVLAGLVWCDQVFPKGLATKEQLLERFCSDELKLQIGGKATVGKGQVRCLFS
jgi:CRISPR-associated protein Cmr4